MILLFVCNIILFISTISDISTALHGDFIDQSESLIGYETEHSITHIELSILYEIYAEITYKIL